MAAVEPGASSDELAAAAAAADAAAVEALQPSAAEDAASAIQGLDLLACARLVLQEPSPHRKAVLTEAVVAAWNDRRIPLPPADAAVPPPPDRPARDADKAGLVPEGLSRHGSRSL